MVLGCKINPMLIKSDENRPQVGKDTKIFKNLMNFK